MKSLKGQLLLATERLVDPNFSKTVVLLFDHSSDGAAGIVLNRPTQILIEDLANKIFDFDSNWKKQLYLGGPVQGPLAAAHTIKEMADLEVLPGVYGALQQDHVSKLIQEKSEPTKFILNYAGWGPGQLEKELDEESWYVLAARAEHLFWEKEKDLWDVCMAEYQGKDLQNALGIRIRPHDPTMN